MIRFLMVGVALLTNSCATFDFCDSVEERELRFNAPPQQDQHLPSMCRHLYNKGRSEEWFECMGVGYK